MARRASTGETNWKKRRDQADSGEEEARRQRELQATQERERDERKAKLGNDADSTARMGVDVYPVPPLPEQHLRKPGLESDLQPRPRYLAPDYRGSGKLDGKVALITGGDSGIGRAVAVLFAREGADVAIGYLSEHKDAEETRRAVEAEGRRGILLPGDVSDPDYALTAVASAIAEFGRLDILVNNAAYQEHQESLLDISDEQLERTFRTNIFSFFYMVRAALPHLSAGSVILNTGSVVGVDGSGGLLDYASTKGAIHAFTKSLAQSLLPKGIRVNCVAPGPVWTPLNAADVNAEEVAMFGADVPIGRPAQPEELAPSFVFLAAAVDSGYITGEILHVFGGSPTP